MASDTQVIEDSGTVLDQNPDRWVKFTSKQGVLLGLFDCIGGGRPLLMDTIMRFSNMSTEAAAGFTIDKASRARNVAMNAPSDIQAIYDEGTVVLQNVTRWPAFTTKAAILRAMFTCIGGDDSAILDVIMRLSNTDTELGFADKASRAA